MENNLPVLVIVDIQPTYDEGEHSGCENILHAALEKVNNTDQRIICYYVGPECGGDSKDDVMFYYLKNGIDEYKLSKIHFIEKDFGFIRDWMDSGVKEDVIVNTLAYMKANNFRDTRNFTDLDWNMATCGEHKKNSKIMGDFVAYPYFHHKVFDKPEIDNIEVIGGGRFECLLEIDLYLKSLGKTTVINEDLCYGSYRPDHKKKIKNKK